MPLIPYQYNLRHQPDQLIEELDQEAGGAAKGKVAFLQVRPPQF